MSALHLTVDFVDNAAAYSAKWEEEDKKEDEKKKKAADKSASWMRLLWRLPWTKKSQHDKPLARNVPKGGTEYTDAKVAAILRDFLQPDTKLSEKAVVASILALIPADASEYGEVSRFSSLCVELAEQIPYSHPSQLKLALLIRRLGETPKFKREYSHKSGEASYSTFQLLWEYLIDQSCPPDEECPNTSVNLKAFTANLYASGLWGASPGFSFSELSYVFEEPRFEKSEAWWKSAEVMEAAQWILWHGQTIFKFILYDHVDEDSWQDNPNNPYLKVGTKLRDVVPAVQPRSVERWRFWKDGFAAVETQPYATEECKNVAGRAARLMEAIEASMLF